MKKVWVRIAIHRAYREDSDQTGRMTVESTISILFTVVIVVRQVSRCLNVYNYNAAAMAVKIEHTVAGYNHGILQQCILDVHASRSMGPQTEQN